MKDEMIVTLYWLRDEKAIRETELKYGAYLSKIAYNILYDIEDSKESVNDTYFKAWNSMPPHKPGRLSAYLGKITRQLSIDIFRKKSRQKRQPSQYILSLSELEECIPGENITQQEIDLHLLAEAIGRYLKTLSERERNVFVGRYFFLDSISEVAAYYHMSESGAKSMLYRIRKALKSYLEQEGFEI